MTEQSLSHTAYFWVNNLYMNEKQFGIQTAHCVSDMSQMSFGSDTFNKWATDHKTVIMFEGTNSGTISRIYEILQFVAKGVHANMGVEIPHVIFREDMESLGGAVTACGFVIPDFLREFVGIFREAPFRTKDYHAYVTEQLLAEKVAKEQHDFVGTASKVAPFDLYNFSDWMATQRLA